MSIVLNKTAIAPLVEHRSLGQLNLNLDNWFPIARKADLKTNKINPVKLWDLEIAVYETQSGEWKALENLCLHKGIPLHLGSIKDDKIICSNHRWSFDENGKCDDIPYLDDHETPPKKCVRTFKAIEKYGLIWIFAGDPSNSDQSELPLINEYNDKNQSYISLSFEVDAHFSVCLENDMDVFHDHLSKSLIGWSEPFLENLERKDKKLSAHYVVKTNPNERAFDRLSLEYSYPHIKCSMGKDNHLYLFHQPLSAYKTKIYFYIFKTGQETLSLSPIRKSIEHFFAKRRIQKSIARHKDLLKTEQKAKDLVEYEHGPEINPVIKALRREMEDQHLLINA